MKHKTFFIIDQSVTSCSCDNGTSSPCTISLILDSITPGAALPPSIRTTSSDFVVSDTPYHRIVSVIYETGCKYISIEIWQALRCWSGSDSKELRNEQFVFVIRYESPQEWTDEQQSANDDGLWSKFRYSHELGYIEVKRRTDKSCIDKRIINLLPFGFTNLASHGYSGNYPFPQVRSILDIQKQCDVSGCTTRSQVWK